MIPAQYAMVRIIADPARDEPTNVGAVVWSDLGSRIVIDEEALVGAARRYPYLATDALLFVEDYLRSGLEAWDMAPQQSVAATLAELSRPPISITEPRFVALPHLGLEAVDLELRAIVDRMVKLPRRSGGGKTPRQELKHHLRSFIEQRLIRENQTLYGRSGNARRVDFLTGSYPIVALDAASLAIKDADEIQRRGDALAFKVSDLLADNPVQFLVHCTFPDDIRFSKSIEGARRSIESTGAEIVTDAFDAARRFREQMSLL